MLEWAQLEFQWTRIRTRSHWRFGFWKTWSQSSLNWLSQSLSCSSEMIKVVESKLIEGEKWNLRDLGPLVTKLVSCVAYLPLFVTLPSRYSFRNIQFWGGRLGGETSGFSAGPLSFYQYESGASASSPAPPPQSSLFSSGGQATVFVPGRLSILLLMILVEWHAERGIRLFDNHSRDLRLRWIPSRWTSSWESFFLPCNAFLSSVFCHVQTWLLALELDKRLCPEPWALAPAPHTCFNSRHRKQLFWSNLPRYNKSWSHVSLRHWYLTRSLACFTGPAEVLYLPRR